MIDPAIAKAKRTYATHKTRPLAYRVKQLTDLRNGLQVMRGELSEALKLDLGRSEFLSWFCELNALETEVTHTISHLKTWMKDEVVDTPSLLMPAKSKIVHEPLGVVLIMGAWNFPYYTTIGPLIPVIAAGNCAVIKPSEFSPNCSKKMKTLLTRYLDTNAYVCIEGAV